MGAPILMNLFKPHWYQSDPEAWFIVVVAALILDGFGFAKHPHSNHYRLSYETGFHVVQTVL